MRLILLSAIINAIEYFLLRQHEKVIVTSRSPQWQTVRNEFIKENPKCAACNGTENLNVHHIKPFEFHPELELDKTNLITLCESKTMNCHFFFGHCKNWKTWNPNVVETVRLVRKDIQNGKAGL